MRLPLVLLVFAGCRFECGASGPLDAERVSGNDTCETAWPLDAAPGAYIYEGSIMSMTAGEAGSCAPQGGKDAVFKLELAARSRAYLDTRGSALDTALWLRRGCAGEEVACNDDTAAVPIPVSSFGATLDPGAYFVFVQQARRIEGDASGEYDLNLRVLAVEAPEGNDACASAYPMKAEDRFYEGSTSALQHDENASCAKGQGALGPDAVFKLDLARRTRVEMTMAGSDYDTVLSIRGGSCAGAEIACNDDWSTAGGLPTHSDLDVARDAGTYFVFVDGAVEDGSSLGPSGAYKLEARFTGQ